MRAACSKNESATSVRPALEHGKRRPYKPHPRMRFQRATFSRHCLTTVAVRVQSLKDRKVAQRVDILLLHIQHHLRVAVLAISVLPKDNRRAPGCCAHNNSCGACCTTGASSSIAACTSPRSRATLPASDCSCARAKRSRLFTRIDSSSMNISIFASSAKRPSGPSEGTKKAVARLLRRSCIPKKIASHTVIALGQFPLRSRATMRNNSSVALFIAIHIRIQCLPVELVNPCSWARRIRHACRMPAPADNPPFRIAAGDACMKTVPAV